MSELRGVCTPVCTIFTEDGGRIDEKAQRKHVDTLVESGIHIICVCGGTGEFSFLTRQERLSLAEVVADQVNGQAKLIVHVSAVMTEETIEYAKHAEGLGADCLLVLPPYFEGPTLEGAFEHYERVANAVSTEIMAYNIPIHSGIDLQADFCRRLMEIDNINYLKDSTGDFIRNQQSIRAEIPLLWHMKTFSCYPISVVQQPEPVMRWAFVPLIIWTRFLRATSLRISFKLDLTIKIMRSIMAA